MPDWAAQLLEAMGRLLVAIAGCEHPCPAVEDCAVELTDDLNKSAYAVEHDKD